MAKQGSAYEDLSQLETFEETMLRWTKQSLTQLRDAYRMQKVYNGTSNRAYEVWGRRVVVRRVRKHRQLSGSSKEYHYVMRRVQNGWFAENERRKKQAAAGKPNVWYSTGFSYRNLDVRLVRANLFSGEVDFQTTLNMLYVEAGVGATGRLHARGRDIAVDRSANWTTRRRYVGNWVPMQGRTHRPATRQQVSLLARRLRWLARQRFLFDLSTWIGYSLHDAMAGGASPQVSAAGTDLDLRFKPVDAQLAARAKEQIAAFEQATIGHVVSRL